MSDTRDSLPRLLVVVMGGVASGKSTLSRALAARLGAERLEADRVRGTLLRAEPPVAGGVEAHWWRDLSAGFESEIYGDLLRRADETLAGGAPLVVDACFPRRSQRDEVRGVAARHGARLLFVSCRAADEVIRERLAVRDRVAPRAGWTAIASLLAAHAEPPDELDPSEHLEVSTERPVAALVEEIEARLLERPLPEAAAGPALRPQLVSFDCWSTLLAEQDWPWAHALRVMALQDAAREAGREVSREAAEGAFDAAWRRHMDVWQSGCVSGAREVAHWGLAELGLDDPHPALEHLVRRFEEASHTSHVVALDGARSLLASLSRAGIPCVLVCDTGLTPGRVVRRLLDRVGLLEHLQALAFSDEVGFPKPDARTFRAALDPLGVAPEAALHVGDLRRTDVAGARALGMQTVRITARHDDAGPGDEADRVVGSHDELAALLGLC